MILDIPIFKTVDILIMGSSSGAVEAAVAARREGKRVLVVGQFAYPGEDICAFMRYWSNTATAPETALACAVFGESPTRWPLMTPMHVKYTLEQAMLSTGVDFIYGAYPVAVLRDADGLPAGAILGDRSGFQAVVAPVIIDASERALFARFLDEASFRPWRSGDYTLRRVVAGDPPSDGNDLPGESLDGYFLVGDRQFECRESRLVTALADATPASIAAADVEARLVSWYPGQLFSSDRPELAWSDRLDSGGHCAEMWCGAGEFDLAAMRCGATSVYVLGPCADVSDEVAQMLAQPSALMALGQRLGDYAASLDVRTVGAVAVDGGDCDSVTGSDVVRRDRYFRLRGAKTIPFDLNRLPVLGEVDVLVAGGGTAGAPAGIAAGRAGASALVVEFSSSLGGVGTEGRIAAYYHGNRVGFSTEIDHALQTLGPKPEVDFPSNSWNTEWKKHWYLRESDAVGTQVWFGSMVVAVAMDSNQVCGAVVATPYGHGLVKAGAVVDCTGNGDVAAAAGAEMINISKAHIAVQGCGLSPLNPSDHYVNTDYTFVDDTDVLDITRTFAVARKKFHDWFDLSQIIDSRQRQQIRGELSLDPVDFLSERTYPDTVTTAQSDFDTHGFTIHPVFMAKPPGRGELRAHVPLRCLLPVGIEGVLVTGLGVSAHRDSLPVIRMQADVQNQGYAAGRAAAMAAEAGTGLREIDIRALQRHLVDIDLLDADVLEHEDSFPLSHEAVGAAVRDGCDDHAGLSVIFAHPAISMPLLREAYVVEADADRKLRIAHVLALMGDDTGLDLLMATVDGREWDEGWNFKGLMQYGFSLSAIDSMLAAMGFTGNPKALPVMLRKLNTLGFDAAFSHYRGLTLGFENLSTPEAAPMFERMLAHVAGNARGDMASIVNESPDGGAETAERNRQLTELLLARGLFACGDPNGKARSVLEAYSKDLHGHYARHAQALLEGSTPMV